MYSGDQSSPELGKNSAEAMVNQTKSIRRQSEGLRAHLGVHHRRRRLAARNSGVGAPAIVGDERQATKSKRKREKDLGGFTNSSRSSKDGLRSR